MYKTETNANPLSSNIYCADPTSVVYNGRVYVYGTNDNQQYEVKGSGNGGGYEHIKSLVVFSSDDMVNWVYHGAIDVAAVCPWIINSWAPSIVSRVEEDGLTHFYLYFSNCGCGVGVITATDPLGPWSDPLGKPLIYQNMQGLQNCPVPFDPGVCIDENGVGWLAFGGGASGKTVHSGVPKIVRLGSDMFTFDSEFVSIDAPYFNEASELNYIDGVYYYTFCNDWNDHRKDWDYENIEPTPRCAMEYMTTKTPLVAESWEYKGAYFYNPGQNAEGQSGMPWGNNHTHFFDFEGKYYILHHAALLEALSGAKDGFRSLMVDYLPVDSDSQSINMTAGSYEGVEQIKPLDPYSENSGAVMFTSADIGFTPGMNPSAKSLSSDAVIYVKGCDFAYGASSFSADVKGEGRIEIRFDSLDSQPAAFIEFQNDDYQIVTSCDFKPSEGRIHNIYIVFSGAEIELKSWNFQKSETSHCPEKSFDK